MSKQSLGDTDCHKRRNPVPVWQGKEYPKHDCGERMVRFHKIHGPEWVQAFQRWSVRLEGHFMDEPGEISCFMNLGNRREAPYVGKRSRYYKAWTVANGDSPQPGAMSPEIFLDKCFLVLVQDSTQGPDFSENGERKLKASGDIYSHISEIRELLHSPLTPLNQESGIKNQESANHPIKQSTNQDCHRERLQGSAGPRRGFTPSEPKSGVDSFCPAQAISEPNKSHCAGSRDTSSQETSGSPRNYCEVFRQPKELLRRRGIQ